MAHINILSYPYPVLVDTSYGVNTLTALQQTISNILHYWRCDPVQLYLHKVHLYYISKNVSVVYKYKNKIKVFLEIS